MTGLGVYWWIGCGIVVVMAFYCLKAIASGVIEQIKIKRDELICEMNKAEASRTQGRERKPDDSTMKGRRKVMGKDSGLQKIREGLIHDLTVEHLPLVAFASRHRLTLDEAWRVIHDLKGGADIEVITAIDGIIEGWGNVVKSEVSVQSKDDKQNETPLRDIQLVGEWLYIRTDNCNRTIQLSYVTDVYVERWGTIVRQDDWPVVFKFAHQGRRDEGVSIKFDTEEEAAAFVKDIFEAIYERVYGRRRDQGSVI